MTSGSGYFPLARIYASVRHRRIERLVISIYLQQCNCCSPVHVSSTAAYWTSRRNVCSLLYLCQIGRPIVLCKSFRSAALYRRVPAESFEHPHLVSLCTLYRQLCMYIVAQALALMLIFTSTLSFLLESHYLSYLFGVYFATILRRI